MRTQIFFLFEIYSKTKTPKQKFIWYIHATSKLHIMSDDKSTRVNSYAIDSENGTQNSRIPRFVSEESRWIHRTAMICSISGSCILWLCLSCFFVFVFWHGLNVMRCNEPTYICSYMYDGDTGSCTVLLATPQGNITCHCPTEGEHGTFDCYIPYGKSEHCFTTDCTEANSEYRKGTNILTVGAIFSAISIGGQLIVCVWYLRKKFKSLAKGENSCL
jgi:hypothetical protein